MSYLVGLHGEGDGGQGLEELWCPPGWILWVGAVHKAEELQHTDWEGLLPGTISTPCQGLKTHDERGAWKPEDLKSRKKTCFL